jgi:hypothetical protein
MIMLPIKENRAASKILGACLIGAVLMLSACATVPLTGRESLRLVSDSELLSLSLKQYDEVLKTSNSCFLENGRKSISYQGGGLEGIGYSGPWKGKASVHGPVSRCLPPRRDGGGKSDEPLKMHLESNPLVSRREIASPIDLSSACCLRQIG